MRPELEKVIAKHDHIFVAYCKRQRMTEGLKQFYRTVAAHLTRNIRGDK